MSYWHTTRLWDARRKSPWNLLLIPAALVPWFLGWWVAAIAMAYTYRVLHPEASFVVLPDTMGGVVIGVGLLFAWCPVAMLMGNVLVRAVPAARRALDGETSEAHGTDFRNSNRGLMRLSAILFPLGLGLSLAGLFL